MRGDEACHLCWLSSFAEVFGSASGQVLVAAERVLSLRPCLIWRGMTRVCAGT